MLIDVNNTNFIPELQSQQPQAFLRHAGLAGLGQEAGTFPSTDTTVLPTPATTTDWATVQAGANSELVFLTNFMRFQMM